MKKLLWIVLILPLVLFSCKKNYTCSYSYYYIPFSVAFMGYTPAELDKIIVVRYTANTNFSAFIAADTFKGADAFRAGDTTYLSGSAYDYNGFLSAEPGMDYKIILPAVSKEYTISGVEKGMAGESWEQDHYCSSGASQARIRPFARTVAGGPYIFGEPQVNDFFIYLGR